MFIEPLDARYLMAARGLDTFFATHGRYAFPKGYAPGDAIASTDSEIFVEVSKGTKRYVAKLTEAGDLDTSYGTNGYAPIPYAANKLAYDANRDLLYVAGTVATASDDRVSELRLTRLLPSGDIDTSYANRGTFAYAQPTPGTDFEFVTASVEQINLLVDGSAVLGVDRAIGVSSGYFTDHTDRSLALFRLRPDGTRDSRFGRRGSTELFSGTEDFRFGPSDNSISFSRPYFANMQTSAKGVVSVIMERFVGAGSTILDEFPPLANETAGQLQIKARTVSAKGAIDESAAYSWTLPNASKDNTAYAGFDGGTVKVVLSQGNMPASTSLFTLRPSQQPKARALSLPGLASVTRVFSDGSGHYFAADSMHVTRLFNDFTVDGTFGLHGVATADRHFNGIFADTSRRILATDDSSLPDSADLTPTTFLHSNPAE